MPIPNNDDEEHIITIKDDFIFGYVNVIDKVMHRKTPYIIHLLKRKEFQPGRYRIRNGQTKRLTQDEFNVIKVDKIMWITLTQDESKGILGIENDDQIIKDYKSYLRCLRMYFSKHDMSFVNHPFMYLHTIEPIEKPIQQTLL